MKTITLDYDVYIKELRESVEAGSNMVMKDILTLGKLPLDSQITIEPIDETSAKLVVMPPKTSQPKKNKRPYKKRVKK